MAAAPIARQVFDYYLLGKVPAGPAPTDDQEEPLKTAASTEASAKR
jgi:hypothetical protein